MSKMKNLYIKTKQKNKYHLMPLWSLLFLLPLVLGNSSLTMITVSIVAFLFVLYVFVVLMVQVTKFPILVLHNDRFYVLDTTFRTFIWFWKAVYRESYITDIECITMSDAGVYVRFNNSKEYGIDYATYETEDQQYLRDYFQDKLTNAECKKCEG
ncbi:hypothetical protein [Sulfurovum sp.]|uniref:hypothetical protein n=1 Tax=Sulfurovum sp. TaxID=1969726 RepID=UPI0035636B80